MFLLFLSVGNEVTVVHMHFWCLDIIHSVIPLSLSYIFTISLTIETVLCITDTLSALTLLLFVKMY